MTHDATTGNGGGNGNAGSTGFDPGEDRHIFVVFTNSEPGRDDEFNAWYDEHHVRDIIGVDGFVRGQRFRLHSDQKTGQVAPPWKYLALYDIVGDVQPIHDRLTEQSPTFVKSSALKNDHVAWVFSYLGDTVERASVDGSVRAATDEAIGARS